MPIDYNSLPLEDLQALKAGKYDNVSMNTLLALKGADSTQNGPSPQEYTKQLTNSPDYKAGMSEFIRKEGTIGTRIREALPSRKTVADFARPLLEGGGAVGGGIIGGTGGAVAGGVGAVPGGVLGAGLGYASGKKVADLIEGSPAPNITGNEWVDPLIQSSLDVGTGATLEMGGQVVAKGLGAAITKIGQARAALRRNTPAITKQGLDAKAGQVIAENAGESPIYAKNAAESADLEIPGYQPSIGEARNDPGLIKLQRGIERQPGTAANTILENKAANQTVVRDYLNNEFIGNESLDDVISSLSQKKAQLEGATRQATDATDIAKSALNPADAQTTGRGVVDAIETTRIPAKKAVNEQYQALPNDSLPTSNTATELKALKKEFRLGDEDVYPSRAIARAEEALQGPKPSMGGHGKPADLQILDAQGLPIRNSIDPTKAEVGFQDLHSLRKDIGRQIQDATTGVNPNRELAMKLQRLKSAIDADIEAGMSQSNAYVDARTAFSDYANKFRTGEIAKITQRGQQASGRNIPDALIAKRVFTPDGADDFIRAVGQENAVTHADQYAANDLLSKANPITGELDAKTAQGWLNKNAATLDKYGLTDKYSTVAKAQAAAETAKAAESEFSKTAASKLLNADVDKALDAAFSTNPKNTAAVVNDLIKQMDADPQGVKGLQNAFKDFLVTKAETTAKTITGENIISPAAVQKEMAKYAPAMDVLYKGEPAKIAALQRVNKAVEIQSRSAKSPLGGGSDTAENMNMAMSILGKAVDLMPGVNMVTKLGKIGLGKLNELNAGELNKLIAQALYDPELAQTLALAAKRYKPEVIAKRIDSHLATLGLYALKPKNNDPLNIRSEQW